VQKVQGPPAAANHGQHVPDDEEAMLKQSAQFYDLFLPGPDKVMAFLKENKAKEGGVAHTYDELRTLIELCYSAALRSAAPRGECQGEERDTGLFTAGW
jgi:hypothetical protein